MATTQSRTIGSRTMTFEAGDLAGSPAVTRNAHGRGAVWYVATVPDVAGAARILDAVLDEIGRAHV